MYRHISIAVPMLDELANVAHLIDQLRLQTFGNFSLYVCVNQPDAWSHGTPEQRRIYIENQQTLDILRKVGDIEVHILDKCTPGLGWTPKHQGVGWARKELLEQILTTRHSDEELIVSLDADTSFGPQYLQQVLDTMNTDPTASALAVPYFHPLSGVEHIDRAMLRYECYMRHYIIHLLEARSPYAFSALGSAMAFPAWAYRRVGGITPLQGGEDFYLMQKFCKTGYILLSTQATVYPQGRISHRVPFGTGPAVGSTLELQCQKYPFFSPEGFQRLAQTYAQLPSLYDADTDTPMTSFMQQQLKTNDLWGPLRKNFKTQERFVRACQERLDGLRILQFLKLHPTGEEYFGQFLTAHRIPHDENLDFASTPVEELDKVRLSLFELEQDLRSNTLCVGCGKDLTQ